MFSSIHSRAELRRIAEFLLRIRAAAYALVAIPILVDPSLTWQWQLTVASAIFMAAVTPLAARRLAGRDGVHIAVAIDLAAAYLLWLLVPWGGVLSLLLSLAALAMAVVLTPPKSATRFASFAVVLELSKIAAVLVGVTGISSTASFSDATSIAILLARAAGLACAYLLLSSINRYFTVGAAFSATGSEVYLELMEAASVGYLVAVDLEVVYANAAASAVLQRPVSRLIGCDLSHVIAPADRAKLIYAMRAARERFAPVHLENVLLDVATAEGARVDMACSIIDYGDNVAVLIAVYERSDQEGEEIGPEATETDYREFFERVPIALYRSLPDGTILRANAALRDLFGAESEDEIAALDVREVYVDGAARDRLSHQLEDTDVVVGFETQMFRMDGQMIWVRDTSRRSVTDEGVFYEGAMFDVTGRRRIEDELWSRVAQQEAMATIGQIALESDDITAVLGDITELVSRVVGAEGVVILRRLSGDALDLTGAGTGLDLTADSVATIAERAHITAAPVVLRTAAEVRFAAPKLADLGVQSCVAVMVPGADADFGTLVVVAGDGRLSTTDDISFLLSVANVLGAAIDRSEANARLEELVRSKDEFVATVSHELRTPLTVVTGMALELNERWNELSDEDVAEFTAMLVEQSRDMSDLIEDLLVAARSDTGNVIVRRDEVDMEHEIEGVLASFLDTGQSVVTVHGVGGIAIGDPIRVRQILRNLITNALRYGGRNIEVVTSLTQGVVSVEVIDDGPGIPQEDQERIFSAYERAHHSAGQPGSVGLGLTVSRTLAELMSGSLTYRYDGGSVFTLELPRALDDVSEGRPVTGITQDEVTGAIRTVGTGRIGVDVAALE